MSESSGRPVRDRLARLGLSTRSLVAVVVAAAAGVGSVVVWSLRPAPPPAASGSTAADGAGLFQVKGCVSCHTGPDGGSSGPGPDLTGLPAIAGERVEGLSAEDYVEQSIREPGAFTVPGFPADLMPTLDVSDDELDVLVEYLLAG